MADALGQAEAVLTRQIDVDQIQVRDVPRGGVFDLLGTDHAGGPVSVVVQEVDGGLTQAVVVFDDQDVQ